MFTGLIQENSRVLALTEDESGMTLEMIRPAAFENLKAGESIAIDGVCLTLTQYEDKTMTFYIGNETLAKSNFSQMKVQKPVNLERSLAFGDRLGGHMVSGHVDGIGEVVKSLVDGKCLALEIRVQSQDFKSIITKGSIAVNGVSLTVNALDHEKKTVSFYLIPETLERTNLGALSMGDKVNIECDQFVKIIATQVLNYMKDQNA